MQNTMEELYQVIVSRKENPADNSYTGYLFAKGLDKILKKVGEEAAEVIIASKNGNKADTMGEIADLAYHVLVLMAQQGITPSDIKEVLDQRAQKAGNLKKINERGAL